MNNNELSITYYLNYDNWSRFLTKIKTMINDIRDRKENHKLRESILRINQMLAAIEKTRQELKRLEWNLEKQPKHEHQRQFETLLNQMNIAIAAVEMEVITVKLFAK
jgi:hypothetical protein